MKGTMYIWLFRLGLAGSYLYPASRALKQLFSVWGKAQIQDHLMDCFSLSKAPEDCRLTAGLNFLRKSTKLTLNSDNWHDNLDLLCCHLLSLTQTSPMILTLVLVQWAMEVTADTSSQVSGMYGASDAADIWRKAGQWVSPVSVVVV